MKVVSSVFVLVAAITMAHSSAIAPTTPNPALNGVTMIAPAPGYECKANGAFPHEDKCEYFYDCYNGVAWLGLCTEVQLFDLKYSGCNFAASVDCGDRERPDGYPPAPFQCPRPDGYFGNPDDCTSFYICERNIPYFHPCQPGLHYHIQNRACDWPHLVDCGERPIPSAQFSSNGTKAHQN